MQFKHPEILYALLLLIIPIIIHLFQLRKFQKVAFTNVQFLKELTIQTRKSLEIRSPNATRPWQHVLESLSGYLLLGQNMLLGKRGFAQAWNFGPSRDANRTVEDILLKTNKEWPALDWHITKLPQPHESNLLYLDSSKANELLQWEPVWSIEQCVSETASWYREFMENDRVISAAQLAQYVSQAQSAGLKWSID